MDLQTLDIILIIPLLWGAYKGFKRGIIIEIASLLALVLGIYGGLNFSKYTANILNSNFEVDPYWIGTLSFALTFIAIILLVYLVAKAIDKVLKFAALGLILRLSGMLFGTLKYAIILAVLIFLFEGFNERFHFLEANWNKNSVLYPLFDNLNNPIQEFIEGLDFDTVDEVIKTV